MLIKRPRNCVHSSAVSPAENFANLQNARMDLIGEIQAIVEYDQHINNTTDPVARETWENIRNEELTHVGELLALLDYIDPSQRTFVQDGINEFNDRINAERRIRD